MNRQQLRVTLRSVYLDDNAEPYLWSDELLDLFIEEAHQEAAIRSLMVRSAIQLELIAGQSEYPLGGNILKLERLRLNGVHRLLSQTTTAELDESGKWETRIGLPDSFVFTSLAYGGDGILMIHPEPNLNIVVSAVTRELPEAMVDDADVPALPPHLHLHLLDWCAFRAFSLKDAEANDEARASKHEIAFEKHFGERHSANALRDRNDRKKHHTKMNTDYF